MQIFDQGVAREIIRQRQERGIDRYDEVWDGVYVMPPLANNPHQKVVGLLVPILHEVVGLPGLGDVYPGANVSDRRKDWTENFRCPDVVVVLKGGRAVDCGTHWFGGPDFLVEIQSPGDETEQKIPFYSKIQVRELLLVQRDSRQLRLLRHDGRALVEVNPSARENQKWLVSVVVPLAFRRRKEKAGPAIEVRRTDAVPGHWTV